LCKTCAEICGWLFEATSSIFGLLMVILDFHTIEIFSFCKSFAQCVVHKKDASKWRLKTFFFKDVSKAHDDES